MYLSSLKLCNILQSSQVLPMTSLDLSSQCSYVVPMTPEKCFSYQSPGREKVMIDTTFINH